jgi:chemotaxis protein MotB
MTTSIGGRIMGKLAALALLGGALVLGGCASGDKDKMALYEQENNALRQKMAEMEASQQDLQAKLAAAESAKTGAPGGRAGLDDYGPGTSVFTRGQDLVIGVAGDVLFDSGKATLKNSAKKTLDRVAADLKGKYSGHTVRVEGYTDSDPIKKSGWKTNERLSGERAMAVEQYLTSKGLSSKQIYFAGFGASDAKGNKAQSRRVEIVVLGSAN